MPTSSNLTPDRIDAKALASFGTKDLLDPEKTRKRFQAIEKKARHALEKCSRPFAAANAHFVPWNLVEQVIERACRTLRVSSTMPCLDFINAYPAPARRLAGLAPRDPDACYPLPIALCPGEVRPDLARLQGHRRAATVAVEDIEMELEQRRARDEQVKLMEANSAARVPAVRRAVRAGFPQRGGRVLRPGDRAKGQVHGKTLNAIRDRIDRFHAMNVFGDGDAARSSPS
jgi:hypothetical protein